MREQEWTLKTLSALMIGVSVAVAAPLGVYMAWLLGYMSSETALRWIGICAWSVATAAPAAVALSITILIRLWND